MSARVLDSLRRMTLHKPALYAGVFMMAAYTVTGASLAGAQDAAVNVQIRSPDGHPIRGALVALVDDAGRTVVEGLSNSAGSRSLSAPSAHYRVRVRRIGFRPFLSDRVEITSGKILSMIVPDGRITLQSITVNARARCGRIDADSARLGMVWSEVTKALRASELTADDLRGIADARRYRKIVSDWGGVVLNDSTRHPLRDQRPFSAANPADLAAKGYVRGNEINGWDYFGPDEAVLLSDEFAATHCFRLVRHPSRPGDIGIGFEPVAGRKIPDIAGTVWLDQSTSELRELAFRFVNAGAASRFGGQGQTSFRRMPSGAWIVSNWWMRMPRLEISSGEGILIRAKGYEEIGGGVIEESIKTGRRGATATVNGTVIDSISGTPLPGATISLCRFSALRDSAGRFTFLDAPTGPATLTLSHPSLYLFGVVAIERPVDIERDGPDVTIATPSLRSLWLRFCSDSAIGVTVDERGILHGFVTDEAGRPVTDAPVAIYWTQYRASPGEGSVVARLSINARTDAAGHYAVCGFRRMVQGSVRATIGRRESERREFNFAPSLISRRDLMLSTNPTGRADSRLDLRIIVTDSATGLPLPDATVVVSGQDGVFRSDDSGRVFARVTSPNLDIVVRKLGYAEQNVHVTLRAGVTSQAHISLAPVQVLSEVRIGGAAVLPPTIARRREQGRGRFIGPDDLSAAADVASVLARSGATVGAAGRFLVRFRHPAGGECWADIFIDGRLSGPAAGSTGSSLAQGAAKGDELGSMSPAAIYAIEVYERASQAPPEYAGVRDGCGVILVWTRSYVENGMH